MFAELDNLRIMVYILESTDCLYEIPIGIGVETTMISFLFLDVIYDLLIVKDL